MMIYIYMIYDCAKGRAEWSKSGVEQERSGTRAERSKSGAESKVGAGAR
jgi:hypothetical protein